MNTVRFKYTRGERVKYISHLDLMKVFERALRRSGIAIAYSKGFNPHPQMVFGLPLSVGVTSQAEYADFQLAEGIEPDEFVHKLNMQLPEGIMIVDAGENDTQTNIMSSIVSACYDLLVANSRNISVSDAEEIIEGFMKRPEIIVKKKRKKDYIDIDIRHMIYSLKIAPEKSSQKVKLIEAVLKAGGKANLKPELLLMALEEVGDMPIGHSRIHRTALFVEDAGALLEPLAACKSSDKG